MGHTTTFWQKGVAVENGEVKNRDNKDNRDNGGNGDIGPAK